MSRRSPFSLGLIASTFAVALPLLAQPAYRVRDINPDGNTSWPRSLTVSGGLMFFVADDGPHGPELWTSDGTESGTARVPGTSGATLVYAGSSGVYFVRTAAVGNDLWKSDGTPGGTSVLKAGVGINPESVIVGPLTFGTSGAALWRTDGTAAGTFDINVVADPPLIRVEQLVASNGLLYFLGTNTSNVDSLWRSDGTVAGTWPIAGVVAEASMERSLAAFGDRVFFAATDAVNGMELWSSDGTPQGTSLVADIAPGTEGSWPEQMTVSGNRLYFTACEPSTGCELWSTDGSAAGTTLVADVRPGTTSSRFGEIVDAGGRLFLENLDDLGLWTSDGTEAGTVALRPGWYPKRLTAVGTRLFFWSASSGILCTSDGTLPGTYLVKQFSGSSGSSPTLQAAFGGLLHFFADDDAYGPQPWKSDGTAGGTTRVAVIRPGESGSFPRDFHEANGSAFFIAASGLWKSDATAEGTTQVLAGIPAYATLEATSKRLFWIGGFGTSPFELTMSDGTAAGTVPVPVPPGLNNVGQLVCTAETAFFSADGPSGEQGLWAADGSAAGTRWLRDFSPHEAPGVLTPVGNGVAFMLYPSSASTSEFWQSDGTASGTSHVKTFTTRDEPICDGWPLQLGRSILLFEDDGSTGCNVWRSDGTTGGTVPLGVVGAGASAFMGRMGSSRGFLVFASNFEIWRTDGTPQGTFLLKSLAAYPSDLTASTREGVYFAVEVGDPPVPSQLWFTDGTVAGTVLLHDFKAGTEDSIISSVTVANGRLLASTVSGYPYRRSLWTSDGTPTGTVKVQDDAFASPGGLPFRGVTLFAGSDPWAGAEPWAMDGSAFAAPVRPTSFWVLSPCRVLDTRLANGFLGGPALAAGSPRVFPVGGACGIPATARSIAANVTVTGATSDGLLRIHAPDIGAPDATVVSFRAGQTRANNATVTLGPDADFTVRFEAPAGNAHVIVDVVGWWE